MRALVNKLSRINDVLALMAGALLLACVLLILIDIVARRFGDSMGGTDEISGYVMAIAVSWGSSYALTSLAHVRIDLLRARLISPVRAIMDAIAILAFAGTTVFIAFRASSVLSKTLTTGALANTPLETPLWIPQSLWLAGWVWFAFTAVVLSVAVLLLLLQGKSRQIDEIAGITPEVPL